MNTYDEHSPYIASGEYLDKLTATYGIQPRMVNPETGEVESDDEVRRRILAELDRIVSEANARVSQP